MFANMLCKLTYVMATYATCAAIVNNFNDTTTKIFSNSEAIALIENPVTQEDIIINSIYELTLDLSAAQWQKERSGNVVISPVSIGALLNMVMLGVRGDTHAELKKMLHFSNNLPEALIHETYQKLLGSVFHQSPRVNATTSSRIYLQEGISVIGLYAQVVQALYNCRVRYVDFSKNPSGSMAAINSWVLETTYGKIKNILSSPLSSETKLVAVNTIYFNGAWENPFNKALTYSSHFNTGFENMTVPMMTKVLTVPYLKGNLSTFDMISIPYKGNKHSMFILTPNSMVSGIRPLQLLEYSLDSTTIGSLINQMRPIKISVNIPRMRLSDVMYLKEDLQSLGVKNLFDPLGADFGRLTTDTGVYMNDIVNEAVLEVTEKGTDPLPGSIRVGSRTGGKNAFILNRPSLLFIRDNSNGLALFWAKVLKPEPIF